MDISEYKGVAGAMQYQGAGDAAALDFKQEEARARASIENAIADAAGGVARVDAADYDNRPDIERNPDPAWRDRPASLEQRLERIAAGQEKIIATLQQAASGVRNVAVDYTRPPERSLENLVGYSPLTDVQAEVTVEAIWDKARQVHAVAQDLGNAFGSMVYGPSPNTPTLASPPMPEDRLQAIYVTLQQALDDINRVAEQMRRRA